MPLYIDGIDGIEKRALTSYNNVPNKVNFRFPAAMTSQLFINNIQPEMDTQQHGKGKWVRWQLANHEESKKTPEPMTE